MGHSMIVSSETYYWSVNLPEDLGETSVAFHTEIQPLLPMHDNSVCTADGHLVEDTRNEREGAREKSAEPQRLSSGPAFPKVPPPQRS